MRHNNLVKFSDFLITAEQTEINRSGKVIWLPVGHAESNCDGCECCVFDRGEGLYEFEEELYVSAEHVKPMKRRGLTGLYLPPPDLIMVDLRYRVDREPLWRMSRRAVKSTNSIQREGCPDIASLPTTSPRASWGQERAFWEPSNNQQQSTTGQYEH